MTETLWAPWRMEYILDDAQDGCFLCRVLAEDKDRENLLLKRGRLCAVVLNRYPYNNGHLLIFPNRHVAQVADLAQDERLEWLDLLVEVQDVIREHMRPDGFNIGINLGRVAGAGLEDHLHLHVVPRWNGDTNFMPVMADIKVIPQALPTLRDELHPLFNP